MRKSRLLLASALTVALGVGAAISGLKPAKVAKADGAPYSQGSVVGKNEARIWIGYDTTNPFYSYTDEGTGIRLWIHSTSSGGDELVYNSITGTFNNNAEGGRRYDYFDVNISVYTNEWYMTVQKFQGGNWKGATNPIQLKSSNACQVYYIWGDWAWDQTAGTVAAGSVDSVDAGFAAKALGGIHTCSSSAVNGYKAFDNYNSTFVKDGENWKTVGNLTDYTLNDYADGDTSYSGTTSRVINAYDKYIAVEALASGNGSSAKTTFDFNLEDESSSNILFVVIPCVAALSLTVCILLLKKKKMSSRK